MGGPDPGSTLMRSLSPKDMTPEIRLKWAKARRDLYRGVLRDPRATESQREEARRKIESARPG